MRQPRVLAFAFLSLVALSGGGSAHSADEKYFLITANIQVPYCQTAKAGFSQAASELKVRSEVAGPESYDPRAEQQARECIGAKT
jgi:ABC-type sugar transport system substrate-binding protein